MNFDRPGFPPPFPPAEADWGIEETSHHRKRFDSVSTSECSQPHRSKEYDLRSPTLCNRTNSFGMNSDILYTGHGRRDNLITMKPCTENFSKFILKYLRLPPIRALLVEKFKYNLVLSNLLDDSLVLSKNEQALEGLLQARSSGEHHVPVSLKRKFSDDGIRLKIVNKKYVLLVPSSLLRPELLFNTISLIIFLLKQIKFSSSRMKLASRIKLFKILLITSTWILKSKRAQATIESVRSLRSLDDFMISNCKVNKAIIAHIIRLKELRLFSSQRKAPAQLSNMGSSAYSESPDRHLDMLLTSLVLNLRYSIRELLPLANGALLEKYCLINSVQVSAIYDTLQSEHDDPLTLEALTAKLSVFNSHRRFFVCQLLTVHDCPSHNFFLLTLSDHLNIDVASDQMSCTATRRAARLDKVLQDHTGTLDHLLGLNEKFKILENLPGSSDYANHDVLAHNFNNNNKADDVLALDSDAELNNLINKLLTVMTSLKYFKKYSQLIANLNNADEHEERLAIFDLFQGDLESCMEIFGTCMGEYKSGFQEKFNSATSVTSSRSNSQRNSLHSEHNFNLKSFRTLSAKSRKNNLIVSPRDSQVSLDTTGSPERADKQSKRVSSGLLLGLLTVLEDPQQTRVQLRANTLKMYNFSGLNRESYNQAALDALTKKANNGHQTARFSRTSMNSNISGLSDLIASTQITTDEDDEENARIELLAEGATQGMSKADLEKKLEESFARIYNLEKPLFVEEDQDQISITKNTTFLRNLEESLSAKPGS
ncbi:hypothetical protein METBIDRAFT_80073 [Metschnikowia bicuspidata var. bicuspidata NRRL YB-4993]|uniref:Myosin-binding domain-containing protein n=1 Tax=Metschnikowia bicuspidata var. bicuspidata NRRL YB-4993 TaxID=869754 RepID=A0A1A0H212_9ASCO|nr:hypothetical protein METBIDRAFT_80073 [Metschnikowia bicuspidata var. bicuspidata NRRL YB-4993]OBA17962.1 hypothetical protein METBIDRAFT_80073 [Metschnikowia bicuspidata var. bicuspidata NRRL YB-4993]